MMAFNPHTAISSDIVSDAVAWRHAIHKHPEVAYHETRTASFVAEKLSEFGLKVHRGLAGTGVVGTLSRGTSRRTIAIRADMDALPIEEKTGLPHASANKGVMHACGHDGHVAMLLAAARVCAQLPDLDGTVHFIFQPAEEGGAGARRMLQDGLFKLFPCEAVYALHNWPALPVGTCVARDGAMMAANAVFEITIAGGGCHGAMPHQGQDTILTACQLVSGLHTIVSRNIDPVAASVLSITQIHAGHAHNVIPDACVIRGAARWFEDAVGTHLERRLHELSVAHASAFNCQARISYERRYPATINDPKAAAFVRSVVSASALGLTVVDAQPSMASEDFAFMLREVPGCYLWLGAGSPHGLHSSHYDFNDELVPLGVRLWVSVVRNSLLRGVIEVQ